MRLSNCKLTAILLCTVMLMIPEVLSAQSRRKPRKIPKTPLSEYFSNYNNPAYSSTDKITIENTKVDSETKTLSIYVNEGFSSQPFTPQLVNEIYATVRTKVDPAYKDYNLIIYAQNVRIEDLIPTNLKEKPDTCRTYNQGFNTSQPWVSRQSEPYKITQGLANRHISLWASHGKYYKNSAHKWEWQRPRLYCTSEDLLTQSIVVPYLIPMLENAGAIIYTPRERDWQKNEVIVDNDTPDIQGVYKEDCSKHEWKTGGTGFAHLREYYIDKENPFEEGSYRIAETVDNERNVSTALWVPYITEEGDYAVYVSYHTLANSVSNATYTIRHQGVETSFGVNQKMGGSTWVYLGTFHFDAGCNTNNCVILSNYSKNEGVVTADAVRFGGGISNIARGDSTIAESLCTGLPRCMEAARYTAIWSGIPYWVYSVKDKDDYGDDINTRPLSSNYVARGSEFLPGDSGLSVPLELCVALHSDAGITRDSSFIGSLSIYTRDFNGGFTAAGLSRLTNRDLGDIILSQVTEDMTSYCGKWNRRQLYDRNYGETREPMIPAVILEMFSHQNWYDMRYAHDPNFKFALARSIYKGIGKYLHTVHPDAGTFISQPLPISALSAVTDINSKKIFLNWMPTNDDTDSSAEPQRYIVYVAKGDMGFDNGHITDKPSFEINPEKGVLYRFKVAALNDGGKSMLSTEVCAAFGGKDKNSILLADAFSRVSAPYTFDSPDSCGFDMDRDAGVIDVRTTEYCGRQLNFDKKGIGKVGSLGLGDSSSEWEGLILAGNTHDYSTRHAKDILTSGAYNISSCEASALMFVRLSYFQLVDLIFGAQKHDATAIKQYKTFTDNMRAQLAEYAMGGGNILVSGAYIGNDMQSDEERMFTENVLKYKYVASISADTVPTKVTGNDISFCIYDAPNEKNYWVRSLDAIEGTGNAFSTMLYEKNGASAAIAYDGKDYRVMAFGFPLDCIKESEKRTSTIVSAVLFLLSDKN